MLYHAYWRSKESRVAHNGFVKADSRNEAFDIVTKKLQKGCNVTAIYEAKEHEITPQSITINFANKSDYKLF